MYALKSKIGFEILSGFNIEAPDQTAQHATTAFPQNRCLKTIEAGTKETTTCPAVSVRLRVRTRLAPPSLTLFLLRPRSSLSWFTRCVSRYFF